MLSVHIGYREVLTLSYLIIRNQFPRMNTFRHIWCRILSGYSPATLISKITDNSYRNETCQEIKAKQLACLPYTARERNAENKITSKKILHIVSHKRLTLVTKLVISIQTIMPFYWMLNNSEILLTSKAGIDKTSISLLCPCRAYRYFSDGITCSVLFRKIASIHYRNVIKIIRVI